MWSPTEEEKVDRAEECFMCGKLETSDHILFQCPIVVFLWTFLRDCLGWDVSPISCDSFFREIVERCRGRKAGGDYILLCMCAVDDLEGSQ